MATPQQQKATGKDAPRQYIPQDERVFLNAEKLRKEDLPTFVTRKLEQERKKR